MKRSISSVYQEFIWRDSEEDLAKKLYNNPPKTFGAAVDQMSELVRKYQETGWFSEEHFNKFRYGVREANRSISALSRKVDYNIDRLENGGIEAAHQSVALAGSCYILNKAATATALSTMAQNSGHDVAPFFFIADYDIVQPELTNIRTPIMGQDGNLISIPVPEGYEYSPISKIPVPKNYDWYQEVEESIRASYRPLFKVLEGPARTLFNERLEQSLGIIRWAYLKSVTLDEWTLHILGRVLNIEGDLGIPLIPSSSPFIRSMLVRGMEFLLTKENRDTFLKVHAESTSHIKEHGYDPGIGVRSSEYVPFYYECPEEQCNRSRTELHYEEKGSVILLSGKCPSCNQTVEVETSSSKPDLESVENFLSPRVDTRQMIIDMLFPVLAHVGGPGETAYYAQVIPIAQALSIPFPMFVKYPRVYFNTPWSESLAKQLKEKEIPVLHQSEMFKLTGKVNRFKKKNRHDEMNAALLDFEALLMDTHNDINRTLNEIVDRMKTPEGKKEKELFTTRLEIERYLSWTFGQFTGGKLGQESSWSWIEWTLNSGLHDIFGPYLRAYVSELKNGSTMFINFSV
ncbi:MAG: bacillithiol biosynthesis BshC [Candidatus Thorarchaeota archaeon]